MATFRMRNDKWQARVRRAGQPLLTRSFPTRADAERWARAVESEMDRGPMASLSEASRTTVRELILRNVREVVPTLRSARDDTIGPSNHPRRWDFDR